MDKSDLLITLASDPEGRRFAATLESMDREIAFFRHRSGQVYFFGILAEVLIIIGKHKIDLPDAAPSLSAGVASFFFAAVAMVGIVLGSEYRRRIRHIKGMRDALLRSVTPAPLFLPLKTERISEILVLYFVLIFSSGLGMAIAWMKCYPGAATFSITLAIAATALAFGGVFVYKCLRRGTEH